MLKKSLLYLIIISICATFIVAETPSEDDFSIQHDCIYYFYGKDCADCQESTLYLQQLQAKYPSLQITQYEVYHNQNNKEILNQYFQAYNVAPKSQGIPAIISRNSYLIGKKSITSFLEQYIIDNDEISCPSVEQAAIVGIAGEKTPQDVLKILPATVLQSAALNDSVRPIMITLLIILVLIIVSIRSVKKTLIGCGLFLVGSYTALLLYGTNNVAGFMAQKTFIFVIAILCIIIALIKIIIFFTLKSDPIASLEKSERVRIEKIKNILSNPIWFLPLGYLTSLFAAANLSKNFLLLKTLHLEGTLATEVTPKIIYYLFLVILPLIIFAICMNLIKMKLEYRSKESSYSDKHLGEWQLHNHRVLNVVVSILVIAISLLLLYA